MLSFSLARHTPRFTALGIRSTMVLNHRLRRTFSSSSSSSSSSSQPLAAVGAAEAGVAEAGVGVKSAPSDAMLVDKHGRFHNYLRISLTERCNLRCQYCMPEEGISLTPAKSVLSADEVVEIARVFVGEGVDKIRFTGGEPLVRKDAVQIIQRVGELRADGLRTIGMTTNAITLSRNLPALMDAGVNALNISLDTMSAAKFQMITRRRGHDRVLRAINDAVEAGVEKVKINCVVMSGFNEDEVLDFVRFTEHLPVEVRFIEYMPFDGNRWDLSKMVSYSDMLDMIHAEFPGAFARVADETLNETAKTWRVDGFKGRIGFITSMSQQFCGSCNRLRITADGNLKACLFGASEVSLRDLMRQHEIAGTTCTTDLTAVISAAVKRKKARHAGMFEIAKNKNRPMTTIGGFHTMTYPSRTIPGGSGGSSGSSVAMSRRPRGVSTSMLPLHGRVKRKVAGALLLSSAFSTTAADSALSHVDATNNMPTMVDITGKSPTQRTAVARAVLSLPANVARLMDPESGEMHSKKGPVLATAIVAGTMAVKRTADWIPFCHPLPIDSCKFTTDLQNVCAEHSADGRRELVIECTVKVCHKTGVEMEALTGATAAALTVYDMCKAITHDMVLQQVQLVKKTGGKSDIVETTSA